MRGRHRKREEETVLPFLYWILEFLRSDVSLAVKPSDAQAMPDLREEVGHQDAVHLGRIHSRPFQPPLRQLKASGRHNSISFVKQSIDVLRPLSWAS